MIDNKQIIVDTHIKTKQWQSIKNAKSKISSATFSIVKNCKISDFLEHDNKNQIEISISLVNDQQIRKINRDFRQKDKSTNVLSFPAHDVSDSIMNFKKLAKTNNYLFLGDIIISLDNIRSEVNQSSADKTFDSHLTHLLLHSILHLIGYDHEDEKQAQQMESLEIEILKSLNIDNPYDHTL